MPKIGTYYGHDAVCGTSNTQCLEMCWGSACEISCTNMRQMTKLYSEWYIKLSIHVHTHLKYAISG